MTDSQIALDYLKRSSTIPSICDEYSLSKADVVASITNFIKMFPESIYRARAYRKLQTELYTTFYKSNVSVKEFASEYGMKIMAFSTLISEAIDDTSIIKSDVIAYKVYKKLLYEGHSLGKLTPKRIVRLMAEQYVSDSHITQRSIARQYGISRSYIIVLFRQAIESGYFSHNLAEQVMTKADNMQFKHFKYYSNR